MIYTWTYRLTLEPDDLDTWDKGLTWRETAQKDLDELNPEEFDSVKLTTSVEFEDGDPDPDSPFKGDESE